MNFGHAAALSPAKAGMRSGLSSAETKVAILLAFSVSTRLADMFNVLVLF
jgi:hypothetical protein